MDYSIKVMQLMMEPLYDHSHLDRVQRKDFTMCYYYYWIIRSASFSYFVPVDITVVIAYKRILNLVNLLKKAFTIILITLTIIMVIAGISFDIVQVFITTRGHLQVNFSLA